MHRLGRWAGYAALGVTSMAMGSCRSPTEITLEVRTDAHCSDLQGISVAVGTLGDALESRPAASTTTSCDPSTGRIGALVVVPSGSKTDEVGIRVVAGLGKSLDACVAPWGPGCIVARRAVRFIPHEPLSVPINLSASCDGVPCNATTTCVNGQCVPARIDSSTCASALGCDDDRLRPVPVFTGCGDVSGLQSSSPWPMAGGCPTRVYRSPYAATTTPTKRWEVSTGRGKPIGSVPAIAADGTMYFGSDDGFMYAFDSSTGAKKWELALGAAVNGDPAIARDGTVVIGTTVSGVAVDVVSHAIKWKNADVASDTVITGGEIWYGTTGTSLAAVDLRTGATLWKSDVGVLGEYGGATVGADGTIYIGNGDFGLYALDPKTHGVRWSYKLIGQVFGGTAIGPDGTVYAGTPQSGGQLVAIDPTGNLRWEQRGATGQCGITVGADGAVFATFGSTLRSYDGATGALRWQWDTGSNLDGGCHPLDAAGTIYGVSNGVVYAVDAATGSPRWQLPVAASSFVTLGDGGMLFVTTDDGRVVAFAPP